jgi:hypothetical protein
VSDYQNAKEGKLAAVEAEQRHLYAKMSISDIAAEVENNQVGKCQEICSGSWGDD